MHFLRGEVGIRDADRSEAELATPLRDAGRKIFEVVRVCFSRLRVQGGIVLARPRRVSNDSNASFDCTRSICGASS